MRRRLIILTLIHQGEMVQPFLCMIQSFLSVLRLIVIAEKQEVYERFPIPLINRLEKHFVAMSTMLSERQEAVVQRLSTWASRFTQVPHSILPMQPK